jgi:hypothetical protein
MRRRLATTLTAMLALSASLPAFAHAFLDHASPAVGSTVHAPPAAVRIWFTQELEPAFSTVRLVDAAGTQVATAAAEVDAKDRTLLVLTLPALTPGRYKVFWRVLSVDTHVTDGSFGFEVAP